MITICLTYFRSLGLANLAAAFYSLSKQDFTDVVEIVVIDNNTEDTVTDISDLISSFVFPVRVRLYPYKHGDPSRTHAWSSNIAVGSVSTPLVFFTRADYLLDFSILQKFREVFDSRPAQWNGFVTANGSHLQSDIGVCEQTPWRTLGPCVFQGQVFYYTAIDSGVWMGRRDAFNHVGGLDESLTAWGHAQTHFQHKLYKAGTEFVRVPEVLFYHPLHSGERDIDLAHSQLAALGVDLWQMWSRYDGPQVY